MPSANAALVCSTAGAVTSRFRRSALTREIADHPDGPRNLIASKRVRVVQVIH